MRVVDCEHDKGPFAAELGGQDGIARLGRCLGALSREPRNDLRLFGRLAADKHLGIDFERGGDPLHPFEREITHPGFEPADRLRRSGWNAGSGEVGQCKALLATDVADAVDHGLPPWITDLVFPSFLHEPRLRKGASIGQEEHPWIASLSNAN